MPKPKRTEESYPVVEVGKPVAVVAKGGRFIGICHAIDSRIEGSRIIKEVKVLVVAGKEDGAAFYVPKRHDEPHLFEMDEVFPILVDIQEKLDPEV